ncbi:MAG: two-component system sensor histidine kinase NtrB [Candidatus Binataceae bacterium]
MDLWHEIVDSLSAAVLVLSAAHEPIAANAAAETMFGASRVTRAFAGRLLKRNPWLAEMAQSCLTTGQNMDAPEATLVLEQRSTAVRVEIVPLLADDARPEAVVVLLRDLSELINAQAAAGEDSLGLSPAGLAHEVKNPLTGIKGATELLAAMLPTDPRARQYCGLILEGVNRIGSLVEQVLAASGPQRLRREPINIHQVLHRALRAAGIATESHADLSIKQDFDPSLPEVIGDAAALERVFLNLIRNALEAIEAGRAHRETDIEGGQVLRLRTTLEARFRVATRGRRRQFLRVEISDSGAGMAPDELRQLFTPFFTTKPSGTGLGLVLSHRIVALHGGKLWAERGGVIPANRFGSTGRPGLENGAPGESVIRSRGMTFFVRLPIGLD